MNQTPEGNTFVPGGIELGIDKVGGIKLAKGGGLSLVGYLIVKVAMVKGWIPAEFQADPDIMMGLMAGATFIGNVVRKFVVKYK